MAYRETRQKLDEYRQKIAALRAEMREVQAAVEPEPVSDYTFSSPQGNVTLAELFGDRDELILIHNMGPGCVYCTLWADGFNGILDHLEDRAAFVLSTPEDPHVQQTFADGRGWRFRIVSHAGTNFADDMGFFTSEGEFAGFQPGVSVFRKSGEDIRRVADASLGPGDDFCALWHLFDLFPEGSDGWGPRYDYGTK